MHYLISQIRLLIQTTVYESMTECCSIYSNGGGGGGGGRVIQTPSELTTPRLVFKEIQANLNNIVKRS